LRILVADSFQILLPELIFDPLVSVASLLVEVLGRILEQGLGPFLALHSFSLHFDVYVRQDDFLQGDRRLILIRDLLRGAVLNLVLELSVGKINHVSFCKYVQHVGHY
jgi:hypothetical protein